MANMHEFNFFARVLLWGLPLYFALSAFAEGDEGCTSQLRCAYATGLETGEVTTTATCINTYLLLLGGPSACEGSAAREMQVSALKARSG
jgi:hypothetical protein